MAEQNNIDIIIYFGGRRIDSYDCVSYDRHPVGFMKICRTTTLAELESIIYEELGLCRNDFQLRIYFKYITCNGSRRREKVLPIKKDRDVQFFFNPMSGYNSVDIYVETEKVSHNINVLDDPFIGNWRTYTSMSSTSDSSTLPAVSKGMGRFGINEDYAGPSTCNQQDEEHVNIEVEAACLLDNDPMNSEPDEVEAEAQNDDNPDNDDEVSIPIMSDVLGSNANGSTSHQQEGIDLNMPGTSKPPSLYRVVIPFFSTTHPEVPADSIDVPTRNWGHKYDSNTGKLALGMIFKSKDHLKAGVQDFSVRFARREYRVVESSSKLWKAMCKYDVETGCNWMLRAIYKSKMGLFKITKYAGPHTCPMNESSAGHCNLGKSMIATYLFGKVLQDPKYDIKNVQQDVKDRFGFEISYHKAWQALKAARDEVYRTLENSVEIG